MHCALILHLEGEDYLKTLGSEIFQNNAKASIQLVSCICTELDH